MFSRLWRVLLPVLALVLGSTLIAPTASSAAPATTTITGWPTVATTVAPGSVVTTSVQVKSGDVFTQRTVILQRRPANSTTWTTMSTQTTAADGKVAVRFTQVAGTYVYRLAVTSTPTAAYVFSAERTVTGALAATTITGWPTTPLSPKPGTTVTAKIRVQTGTGYVSRKVILQRRPAGSSTWLTVSTQNTAADGTLNVSFVSISGTQVYRLAVTSIPSATYAFSGERTVTAAKLDTVVEGWVSDTFTTTAGAEAWSNWMKVRTGNAYPAREVIIQARLEDSGEWVTLGKGTTGVDETFRVRLGFDEPVRVFMRLAVPSTATANYTFTSERLIVVTPAPSARTQSDEINHASALR